MSRNAKNARNNTIAKNWSKQRKSGSKGPARTAKKNTKKNTWFSKKKDGKLTPRAPSVTATPADEE